MIVLNSLNDIFPSPLRSAFIIDARDLLRLTRGRSSLGVRKPSPSLSSRSKIFLTVSPRLDPPARATLLDLDGALLRALALALLFFAAGRRIAGRLLGRALGLGVAALRAPETRTLLPPPTLVFFSSDFLKSGAGVPLCDGGFQGIPSKDCRSCPCTPAAMRLLQN